MTTPGECTCQTNCASCGPTGTGCTCAQDHCNCADCPKKAHTAQCHCQTGAGDTCGCKTSNKPCNCS